MSCVRLQRRFYSDKEKDKKNKDHQKNLDEHAKEIRKVLGEESQIQSKEFAEDI